MATAPIMVVAFDRAFLFSSFREAWRARRALYSGLAATWVVLALLLATRPRPHSAGFSAGVSPWTYLLNQAPAILRYLQQSVWPNDLVLLYGWPRLLTLVDVWPQALAICVLLGLTAIALWRQPQIGFIGAWFWITLAPTSSIVPIATEVAAERRMYLPLAAVVLLVVVGLVLLWDKLKRRLPAAASGREAGAVVAGMALVVAASGLGFALARGWGWERCARLASVMGSIKIAHRGGQNHAPTRDEIGRKLTESFGDPL